MTKIELLYPNLSKKAVSFTIDDGNMKMDKIFKDIVEPYGIKGTFNLCPNYHREEAPEFYREFYKGYDIANHTKYHPGLTPKPLSEYTVGTEPFSRETSDTTKLYPFELDEQVYYIHSRGIWWGKTTSPEHYNYLVECGKTELEEIFARDNIRDFVWPGCRQNSDIVCDYVKEHYRSARTTGCVLDRTNFDLPHDLSNWSYNACHSNLIEVMEKFEKYPDDYKLKFFSFGVHSVDFETNGKWDELREFAERFGNRPDEFWYASIKDIFDYYEATQKLIISDSEIKNCSDIKIFVRVDGVVTEIQPNSSEKI